MQNLEADDGAQGISHVNTNSSHPNQVKRFVSGELTIQHGDRSLFLSAVPLFLKQSCKENWVCQHCLQQFIFRKWYRIWCFNLLNLFVNGIFTERFHFFLLVLFSSAHFTDCQLSPSFWLCLCTNSRLCCVHFLYHWCKICNVLCWLTQVSKRQHDPCWLD